MTMRGKHAFTITAENAANGGDPFRVVVRDGSNIPLMEMDALTKSHARQVAESLALLLPILRPGGMAVVSPCQARCA